MISRSHCHLLVFAWATVVAAYGPVMAASAPTSPVPPRPSFAEVEATVADYLATAKSQTAEDLLTTSHAIAILDAIEKLGWKLSDRGAIERRTVPDDAFLSKQLRTTAGRKFMGKISALPLGYDQLDQLSQMPQGRSTVERLVRGPDGHKLLEYMTEEKGGRELAKMLSKDSKQNLTQPTGKIYTAEQLLRELKTLYDAPASSVAVPKKR